MRIHYVYVFYQAVCIDIGRREQQNIHNHINIFILTHIRILHRKSLLFEIIFIFNMPDRKSEPIWMNSQKSCGHQIRSMNGSIKKHTVYIRFATISQFSETTQFCALNLPLQIHSANWSSFRCHTYVHRWLSIARWQKKTHILCVYQFCKRCFCPRPLNHTAKIYANKLPHT